MLPRRNVMLNQSDVASPRYAPESLGSALTASLNVASAMSWSRLYVAVAALARRAADAGLARAGPAARTRTALQARAWTPRRPVMSRSYAVPPACARLCVLHTIRVDYGQDRHSP